MVLHKFLGSLACVSALAFNPPLLADYIHTPTLTKEAENLAYAALCERVCASNTFGFAYFNTQGIDKEARQEVRKLESELAHAIEVAKARLKTQSALFREYNEKVLYSCLAFQTLLNNLLSPHSIGSINEVSDIVLFGKGIYEAQGAFGNV